MITYYLLIVNSKDLIHTRLLHLSKGHLWSAQASLFIKILLLFMLHPQTEHSLLVESYLSQDKHMANLSLICCCVLLGNPSQICHHKELRNVFNLRNVMLFICGLKSWLYRNYRIVFV